MRYLTEDECNALGPPGSQNEVTPIVDNAGTVIAVYVYTRHAAYRTAHKHPYGSTVYNRVIEASDKRHS